MIQSNTPLTILRDLALDRPCSSAINCVISSKCKVSFVLEDTTTAAAAVVVVVVSVLDSFVPPMPESL